MMRKEIKEELELKKNRLERYLAREAVMLSEEGVKSYGTGTKNATRYDTDLAEIRKAIKELEDDIKDLTAALSGNKNIRVVGVVTRDW